MIEAIFKCSRCKPGRSSSFMDTIVAECGKAKARPTTSCAVPDEIVCSDEGDRSSGRDGEQLFLPMTSRPVRQNIRAAITERLAEAFAEKEEWLAVIRRGRLPVREEDCPQDDLKRPQASRRPCDLHRSVLWQLKFDHAS